MSKEDNFDLNSKSNIKFPPHYELGRTETRYKRSHSIIIKYKFKKEDMTDFYKVLDTIVKEPYSKWTKNTTCYIFDENEDNDTFFKIMVYKETNYFIVISGSGFLKWYIKDDIYLKLP